MSTKRVKISFNSVNKGKITVIKASEIAESNKNIKEAMKEVVREYRKNETLWQQEASKLILNS